MLNEENLFIVGAVLLLVLIIIVLIFPLFKGNKTDLDNNSDNGNDDDNKNKNVNLSILKDELSELKFQLEKGIINEQQFKNLEYELQVKALAIANEKNNSNENIKIDGSPAKYTSWIIILFLPILIGITYYILGNSNSLNPALREPSNELTLEQVIMLVQRLETKLKMEPNNTEGWLMLARSYRMLDNHQKAVEAFAKVETEIYKNSELLANYAESLAAVSPDGLNGKPMQLLEQALKLDSNNAHALFLLGMAEATNNNLQKAKQYWERLLPLTIPGTELYLTIENGIKLINEEIAKETQNKK